MGFGDPRKVFDWPTSPQGSLIVHMLVDPCSTRPVNDNQVIETEQQCCVDGGCCHSASGTGGTLLQCSRSLTECSLVFKQFLKIYSVIVIISSANKYRKQKQYAYLTITYRSNDNYTDIYNGKMANCCQKVRGNAHWQTSCHFSYPWYNPIIVWVAQSASSVTNATSLSPEICVCGWLGSKHQLTNECHFSWPWYNPMWLTGLKAPTN